MARRPKKNARAVRRQGDAAIKPMVGGIALARVPLFLNKLPLGKAFAVLTPVGLLMRAADVPRQPVQRAAAQSVPTAAGQSSGDVNATTPWDAARPVGVCNGRPYTCGTFIDAVSAVPDRFAVLLQYLLPKKALTQFAGWVASAEAGALTTGLIRWFIGRYQVNMAEAANPDPAAYVSFNAFFTRALRPEARPLSAADLLCPVDGAISQCGAIEGDQIFQAKGHRYSTTALLGGDAELAERFRGGHFATLYLSPRDYHRIHMPCDGVLRRMIHVPGDLFSVNPATARGVPGLFARNERVVCVFDGPTGPFVLVLVGATIVGSMATVWHGVVNPPRPGRVRQWSYGDHQTSLARGAEMGRFLLGSTVVMLFPAGPMKFEPGWIPARPVRMGEAMASLQA